MYVPTNVCVHKCESRCRKLQLLLCSYNRIHICVYTCMYVRIYVHMNVCTYKCMCWHMWEQTQATPNLLALAYVFIFACMYICTYAWMCVCTYVCVHTCECRRGQCQLLLRSYPRLWHRPGVCCRVLQGVAGCCRVLQGVAGCCKVLQGVAGCCRVLQDVAGGCSVL